TMRYIPKYNVFMVVNSTNGNVYFYRHSAYNPSAATVEITSPADNFLTNQGSIPVAWTVNGVIQTSGTTETLGREGANLIKRCHVNVCDSVTVFRDQTPPAVVITSPPSSHVTTDATIWVRWTLDGIPDSLAYSLVPGTNLIVVGFTDAAGNRGADTVSVTRGTTPSGGPVFPAGANLVASNIRSTSMTLSWTAATASGGLKEYVLYKDRAPIATIRAPATTYTAVGLLRDKDHAFRVEAVDSAQRRSINGPMRNFRTGDQLPPEPSTVASPIPHGQPTLLASAVAFLHEGPNAIQSGVTDSLMDPVRAVVVRGAVRSRSGAMLPGVTVSVLGHSEVGSTLSRQNGEFDLVVNGGGALVLVYAVDGYLESQRTFHPRWQEYVVLDTVTLVPRDTVVGTVDLSSGAPMQAIQAGAVTDESGTRRATLIVPSGTKASLLLPDGTQQSLGSMRVRMTEYTVGASGPSAMPASLPPSSAYTYALDYTVEEALAANAGGVVFEAPVYAYVENFVGIPVGHAVPSAYHDKAKGVWVPQDDGRVIKIAAIQGGMADLVVDTSGLTASETYLHSLGITDSERIRLAELHSVNQTLWRVPIRHFSSYDYNFPVGLPDDKKFPKAAKAKGDEDPNECDTRKGSIIDCHRQSLGETIRFPGLPSMNYRSHRVASRRWHRLEIAVTGPSVPLSVSHITLDVTIAGRKYHYVYPRATNLTQVVEWDGLDIYGRPLKGKQPYSYSISYAYEVVYAPPPSLPSVFSGGLYVPRSFGTPSGLDFSSPVEARTTYDLSDTYTGYLGSIDVDGIAPGWTLENHHVYDPTDGVLHMGDGQDVGARSGLGAIYTVAGSGSRAPKEGQLAKAARLDFINGMDIGPEGDLYVACRWDSTIWRIERDGMLRKMAQGRPWYDVNVAPDGNLYLTDGGGNRIWKRGLDGTLSVVAGTGSSSFWGDGNPATAARLNMPNTAVQGPDGSLYIADRGNHRVRKVTPDGIIQTVAGTGATAFNGDGIPAREANMSVTYLAVAADGSLYVADGANCRIRRIDADGIVTTVAGNGISGTLGDGGPALEAQITADRIKVANTKAGGTLIYISDELNNTIRVIDENGIIHRLAGGGANTSKDGIR
ncbi:MAG TPA: hypothetical protein VK465_07335, partial [Fibrobacteria bacterium]|nr:hypothetical protein [Fibrobacteria bacterium]